MPIRSNPELTCISGRDDVSGSSLEAQAIDYPYRIPGKSCEAALHSLDTFSSGEASNLVSEKRAAMNESCAGSVPDLTDASFRLIGFALVLAWVELRWHWWLPCFLHGHVAEEIRRCFDGRPHRCWHRAPSLSCSLATDGTALLFDPLETTDCLHTT